jgi:hypothetical protein
MTYAITSWSIVHFMCTALTSSTLMTTCGVKQGREIQVLTCNKWITFLFIHTMLICTIWSNTATFEISCPHILVSDIWLLLNKAHLSVTLHEQWVRTGCRIQNTEFCWKKLTGRNQYEDLGPNGMVILEWSQGNKQVTRVWTRFLWLNVEMDPCAHGMNTQVP